MKRFHCMASLHCHYSHFSSIVPCYANRDFNTKINNTDKVMRARAPTLSCTLINYYKLLFHYYRLRKHAHCFVPDLIACFDSAPPRNNTTKRRVHTHFQRTGATTPRAIHGPHKHIMPFSDCSVRARFCALCLPAKRTSSAVVRCKTLEDERQPRVFKWQIGARRMPPSAHTTRESRVDGELVRAL